MKRRDFLKSSAALTGASLMSGLGLNRLWAQNSVSGSRPNILFFMVDELRYPTVFPNGITDADGFFKAFMPNLYNRLWTQGVKFGNHHTAANACTPSRGVMITGLYSQQSWLFMTIVAPPTNPPPILEGQPVLNPAYPTYGRLLQEMFGYQTPYRGKWHVSIPQQNMGGLQAYGFDYDTYPDPTGFNLQGTYGQEPSFHNDEYIANQAVGVLKNLTPADQPFCLTVSFVNPHDREFFPFGTEFQTFNNPIFKNGSINPNKYAPGQTYPGNGPVVPWGQNGLKSPPVFDYPDLPPNWETDADWVARMKPSTQTLIKDFSNLTWGGATEDPLQNDFTIAKYKATDLNPVLGVAYGPFSYWRRGLDSYTQVIQIVDSQIGAVLDQLEALPQSVVENTIVVFCSDHGEYAGAHGLLQGKIGTIYEEAWHIPLIVVDPSGRFTGDINDIRMGLTSSVDLMPMLVTLGDLGSTDWMTGDLAAIYGQRHDMISMLKSKDAPGRPYVLFATDEVVPNVYNFNGAPTHVLGFRTDEYKVGISAPWLPATSEIDPTQVQPELYDYSTANGQLELDNSLGDPRLQPTVTELLTNIIPNELQQLLPGSLSDPTSLRAQQASSKVAALAYRAIFDNINPQELNANGGIRELLGYGGQF